MNRDQTSRLANHTSTPSSQQGLRQPGSSNNRNHESRGPLNIRPKNVPVEGRAARTAQDRTGSSVAVSEGPSSQDIAADETLREEQSTLRSLKATSPESGHSPNGLQSSLVCECVCGSKIRFPQSMLGKTRPCRKCRQPVTLSSDSTQSLRPETAANDTSSNQLLREAVRKAVSRLRSSEAGREDTGLRKTLSTKKLKELSSNLESNSASAESRKTPVEASILALGKSNDLRACELIAPLRNDTQESVRHAVAMAVGELKDRQAVAVALELLDDTSPSVVEESIRSLRKLADTSAVRPLMYVGLDNQLLRIHAMEVVVHFGESAVTELLSLLNEAHPASLGDTVTALGRIGDKRAVPSLMLLMDQADPRLLPKVLEAIGRLGDSSALAKIINLLDDPDDSIKLQAIKAVQRMPSRRAEKPILRIMRSTQNRELKRHAILALATTASENAIPALEEALTTADHDLKKTIAESLGQISTISASEKLVELLNERDPVIVTKALKGMRKSPPLSAIPALTRLAKHPNSDIRRYSIEAFAGLDDAAAYDLLEQHLLNDESTRVRAAAARGLGRIGNKQAIPALERSLRGESTVRCAAIQSLTALNDGSVIPALLASLKDSSPEVRYHAVSGLGKLRANQAINRIVGMLEDPDDTVRLGAAKALQDLGSKRTGLPWTRKIVSVASRMIPDGVAGVLPQAAVLAAVSIVFMAGGIVWFTSSTSTASLENSLAIMTAPAVKQALCIPGSNHVLLVRESGPSDIWDAKTGQFKTWAKTPQLTSWTGSPPTLMLKQGNAMSSWAPGRKPAINRRIKLPNSSEFNLSENGEIAVYVGRSHQVRLWNAVEGKDIGPVMLEQSPLPVLSADGSLIAGADANGDIVLLDLKAGKQIGTVGQAGSVNSEPSDTSRYQEMLFCSEGNSLAIIRSDSVVLVTVEETGLSTRKIDTVIRSRYTKFPDSSSLYAAMSVSVTRLNLNSGESQKWTIPGQGVDINSLSLSADQKYAALSADQEKFGWVINLTDGSVQELSPTAWPSE